MAISITHRLPIINGFVSIPDGQILAPTSITVAEALDLIPGSKVIRLNGGRPAVGPVQEGVSAGVTYDINDTETHRQDRTQLYLELPSFNADSSVSDYYQTLRDAAGV